VAGALHITTFDGLQFSCQGQGDFILLRNSLSGFQIQGQFRKKLDLLTFLTGIAVQSEHSAPIVEIMISNETNSVPTACLVNGESCRTSTSLYEDEFYVIKASDQKHEVVVKATNVTVTIAFVDVGIPHLELRVFLPRTYTRIDFGSRLGGLLGVPNDDPYDDWAGNSVPDFSSDLLHHQDGYNYCMATWCLRHVSLFTYPAGSSFESFSRCDDPYPGAVDVSSASSAIRELCGNDVTCLTDGVSMGLAAAQHLLKAESLTGGASFIRFNPSTIQVQNTLLMEITIDLSNEIGKKLPGYFSVLIFNPESQRRYYANVDLTDNWNGIGRDGVYSKAIAIRSDVPGERLAIFVDSDCLSNTMTQFNAIRSYSTASGIGQHVVSDTDVVVGTMSADRMFPVFIEYEYYEDRLYTSLYFSTTFLNTSTSPACKNFGPSPYLSRDGHYVFLSESFDYGQWKSGSTTITMNAAWSKLASWRPAVAIVRFQTDENSQRVVFAFEPGRSSEDICETKIGQVDVTRTEAGGLELVVTKFAHILPPTASPTTASPTVTSFPSASPSIAPSESPTASLAPSLPRTTSPTLSPVGSRTILQVTPPIIPVGIPVLVTFTVDLRSLPRRKYRLVSGGFRLFRVDLESGASTAVTDLSDRGSGIGRDRAADDGIFSGVLALRSDRPGESFSFKAVPITFEPFKNSSLTVQSLSAVRSSLTDSGSNETEIIGVLKVPRFAFRSKLVIKFVTPFDQGQLGGGVTFRGEAACNGAHSARNRALYVPTFTYWDGYAATISIGRAVAWYGAADGPFTIDVYAGWLDSDSRGPAVIHVIAVDPNERATTTSFAVDPGLPYEDDCSTKVGQVKVTVSEAGDAVIEVIRTLGNTRQPSPAPTRYPTGKPSASASPTDSLSPSLHPTVSSKPSASPIPTPKPSVVQTNSPIPDEIPGLFD
jgi:von Willebrand factor type D domain